MMRTIAVFNQKGGCGKTTTTINLAASLAEAGKRTLIVDLDPQGHSTIGTNVKKEDVECSTFEVLAETDGGQRLSLADIAWEVLDRLFLAPASIMLSAFEQRLGGADGREERLLEALRRVDHIYDFVVIDCGPAMNLLSVNAIRAADTVLIPVETGFFCVESVDRVRETVDLVARRTGHKPRTLVLPTMYDPRTKSDRASYRNLKTRYAELLAETTIRFNAKLKEAAAAGSPITEFFPGCRGHRDFQALAQELMATTLEVRMAEVREQAGAQAAVQQRVIETLNQTVLGASLVDEGVVFVARAPGAKRVQIAGSFNNWNPEAGSMVPDESDGHLWRLKLPIPDGRHQYRYVIDGRWTADPANPTSLPNEFGETNSVVEIARRQ
jgi:chromosome partitioning protein